MAHPAIQPVGDRILIQYNKAREQVAGELIIPDSAQEKSQEATVIALGRGRRRKDGAIEAFDVKVGETVLVAKYGGSDVRLDEEKYSLVREEDILAVLG